MSAQFGKVALLHGGVSPEREVSLNSAVMVGRALDGMCEEVLRFDPAERSLAELLDEKVDLVFNILHGGAGEDGRIKSTLDMLGIPCTGSSYMASVVASDKNLSKLLWLNEGLPTAPWFMVTAADDKVLDEIELSLGHELFVKPNNGGSSIATTKVTDRQELVLAIAEALQVDDKVMVEQCVNGMELTYPLLGDELLPGIRIEVAENFYDYAAKYELGTTSYICPPQLVGEVDGEARSVALAAFQALGCSGWGRVDMMVSGREMFLLEVNTVPGMTDHSLVPRSAAVAGIDQRELVARILEQVT